MGAYDATRTYDDIPESCWPQMRDSEQMMMSNKILMACLSGKNYLQISKFLKVMEETGMSHILNYLINSGGIPYNSLNSSNKLA